VNYRVIANETLERCEYDLHGTLDVCVDTSFEIISFVIDCFGSWNISFYLGPFGL
jgi:hypothetical protein